MDVLPFRGEVVWLSADQGGRQSGPPRPTDPDDTYCSVGYVPPHDQDSGIASFCLAGFTPGAWRSAARGGWLIARDDEPQRVEPGDVVVVCEGRRVVAYFHVSEVVKPR